jgi:hypothetical protein
VGALLTVPVTPARLNSSTARSVPISVTLLAHERVAPTYTSLGGPIARAAASLAAEPRRLGTIAAGAVAALPRAITAARAIAVARVISAAGTTPGSAAMVAALGGRSSAGASGVDAVAGPILAAAAAARPDVGSAAAYTALRSAFELAGGPTAFVALSGVVAAQEAAMAALEEARRERAEARRERAEARRERAEARRERAEARRQLAERLERQRERAERQQERAERRREAERQARAAERRERAAERRERQRDRDRGPVSGGGWNVAPVVTWYGPGFYGNGTACGQRYTREIIGVAHKTLPCGTLVQFQWRGITATAPVIDRGPYGPPGYDFDFSARLSCEIFSPGPKRGCATRFDVLWRVVGRR